MHSEGMGVQGATGSACFEEWGEAQDLGFVLRVRAGRDGGAVVALRFSCLDWQA